MEKLTPEDSQQGLYDQMRCFENKINELVDHANQCTGRSFDFVADIHHLKKNQQLKYHHERLAKLETGLATFQESGRALIDRVRNLENKQPCDMTATAACMLNDAEQTNTLLREKVKDQEVRIEQLKILNESLGRLAFEKTR